MSPKTIIVTGASRGIGLAIAKHLLTAPRSSNLVILARTKEPLQQLKDQYKGQVEVLSGDLADFSLGKKAVDLAVSAFGRLDGVVLNHGALGPIGGIAEADLEAWKGALDVNFLSAVAFAKAALPHLRESKGKIIMTSSGAAANGYIGWGLYGASKAAMNHLALTLQSEEPDVTTVSIRPGMVDTDMQLELREEHLGNMGKDASKFTSAHENGKLLKPEQPGHVIAKLALDAPYDLSGKFLSWDHPALEAFQE
ncbi:hypothetical protein FQN54_002760 [Arachnomyces sp. PD_36]|nr:hypothetical protein FQN54_002760 [Arachnomyces sp. PD_36]